MQHIWKVYVLASMLGICANILLNSMEKTVLQKSSQYGSNVYWTLSLKEMRDVKLSSLKYWHLNQNTMLWCDKIKKCAGVFDPSRNVGTVES